MQHGFSAVKKAHTRVKVGGGMPGNVKKFWSFRVFKPYWPDCADCVFEFGGASRDGGGSGGKLGLLVVEFDRRDLAGENCLDSLGRQGKPELGIAHQDAVPQLIGDELF